MQSSLLPLFLFLIFLLPNIVYGQGKTINLIYTGGVAGELEPCGCSPKTDFGGIPRRAGYITENRKELFPYILIDAGNFSDEDTPQGRLKTETMLTAFRTMKYDVIALLEMEKAMPANFIDRFVKKNNIPALFDRPQAQPSLSLRRDDLNIQISIDQKDYKARHLNILLTDQTVSVISPLERWDVVILSSGEILEEPLKVGETIIVSGYPRGERLGILTLKVDKQARILEYEHRWQLLGREIKEDLDVRSVLDEYNIKVAKLLEESYNPPKDSDYFGISKCKECHQPFVEIWENTQHADAFSTLEQHGKTKDPECLKCHTVGFGKEGGFYSIGVTPGLANVQCEACHGKSRDHLSDFSKPMKVVGTETCLSCHTKRQSPDFDHSIYMEMIKHW